MSASWNKETTAQEVVDTFGDNIKNRVTVVTGPSPGGIGYETARAIATKEPKLLILVGRDPKKLEQARSDILKESPKANIKNVILDLESLDSVRAGAKEINALGNIDVLINNAAIMMCPYGKTKDGFEIQWGTNYVAPWLLTNLLLPNMLKTDAPRVVFVSSVGHRFSDIIWDDIGFSGGKTYNNAISYGQSKTASVLNAVALAERYGPKLTAVSLHPGGIATNLMRHLTAEDMKGVVGEFFEEDGVTPKSCVFVKSIPQGASTSLMAAFTPKVANGSYFADCQPGIVKGVEAGVSPGLQGTFVDPYALDKAAAKKLWAVTEQMVGENF